MSLLLLFNLSKATRRAAIRVRRLRSLGTLAEPGPEPEAKEPAPAEPAPAEPGAVSPKMSIIAI